MQLRHLILRLFVCLSLATTGFSSVIFPGDYLHWGNKDRSRIRTPPKQVTCAAGDTSRRGACGVERRAELSQQLAFTPVHAALGISTAATLGYIGQKLQSESVRRALYFWYHAGPVVLHYKFTRWHLAWTRAPLEKRDLVYNSLHDRYCQRCLDIALHLKGLYIKIAQIVSSRPDFVPPQYIELFTAVQDSMPQQSIEEISRIIDNNLRSGLGKSFDEVFEAIDPVALGSASIGQVHRATLRDSGGAQRFSKDIAVKVMHDGAEDRFHYDFQVFRSLCKIALSGWEPILDECYRQIMTEFDYRKEADSLHFVRKHLGKSRYRRVVHVPEPLFDLCTKEMLVMELLNGKKLADSLEDDLAHALDGADIESRDFLQRKRLELILGTDKMKELGYATVDSLKEKLGSMGIVNKANLLRLYWKAEKYVNLLVDVQGYQLLSLGCFNGDPHPGNLMVLDDGKLGLIDFGQTKRISNKDRLGVARVIEAIGSKKHDSDIANAMRNLGFRTKADKDEVLAKYAYLFFDSDIEGKELGCATPQMYFSFLNKIDPLLHVPDVAIFVARSSFIIRGMGTVFGKQIRTSARWKNQAERVLKVGQSLEA